MFPACWKVEVKDGSGQQRDEFGWNKPTDGEEQRHQRILDLLVTKHEMEIRLINMAKHFQFRI